MLNIPFCLLPAGGGLPHEKSKRQQQPTTRSSKRGAFADLAAGRRRSSLGTHGLKNLSETGPYPSDVDEMGWRTTGKTCPVALVMLPYDEKLK
jgi:hypothetical protein